MEDVFLLLFMGASAGIIAAGYIDLCRGARMSRQIGLGSAFALYVGGVMLANYDIALHRFVHHQVELPPGPMGIGEVICAVIAYPICLRFWRWLETKRKVPQR